MDPRVIYEIWAPPGGHWSPWAKPVLFAHLREAEALPPVAVPVIPMEGEPTQAPDIALVLDLPGLESIGLGLDLLRLGFRPVPLFNACPIPMYAGPAALEVVPATIMLSALLHGTEQLRSAGLAPNAPPAFLLDTHRKGTDHPLTPGCFDNRWVVFPTDFPSANFLASRGIAGVLIIHRGALGEDLVDVLRGWRQQGLILSHIDLNRSQVPEPMTLTSSWWAGFTRLARRLWVLLTLRRNPRGGFGGFLPESEAAG